MYDQLVANNAKSTLSVAVTSNTQASITLQSGHGTRFPTPKAGEYFNVTLDDGTNVEICRCVDNTSDVLTVVRGVEGTTAQSSFSVNVTRVQLRLTADGLRNLTIRRDASLRLVQACGNINSWQVLGATIPSELGTRAAATLTNSSLRESAERLRFSTSQSAQTPAAWRIAQPTVSGQKGYRVGFRFGIALPTNSSHFFVGLINTTGAVGSVYPPSSITNGIAVGWDNAGSLQGTFLNIYASNSQGPASKLSLGSYFNVNTQAWYEVEFFQQQGNARIDYTVRRLDVASIADITSYFTTGIPDNSLWLSPHMLGTTMVTSQFAAELGTVWWI
jgi:hypothetical protein